MTEFSVFMPTSGYSTREQLARGRFFKGLQNYMENKNEGNESKIILGDFNCTMDKMDKEDENKTQRLYRGYSNNALSKLVVDNRHEDLWRRETPDSPEFTLHNRSFDKDPGPYIWVYIDIKNAKNAKINHIMVSFTDHYNAISIDRLFSKTKIGKDSWYFLLCKLEFSSAKRLFFSFIKNTKKQTVFIK